MVLLLESPKLYVLTCHRLSLGQACLHSFTSIFRAELLYDFCTFFCINHACTLLGGSIRFSNVLIRRAYGTISLAIVPSSTLISLCASSARDIHLGGGLLLSIVNVKHGLLNVVLQVWSKHALNLLLCGITFRLWGCFVKDTWTLIDNSLLEEIDSRILIAIVKEGWSLAVLERLDVQAWFVMSERSVGVLVSDKRFRSQFLLVLVVGKSVSWCTFARTLLSSWCRYWGVILSSPARS